MIFIVSWVDYCNKYGMDSRMEVSECMHFNDITTLILNRDSGQSVCPTSHSRRIFSDSLLLLVISTTLPLAESTGISMCAQVVYSVEAYQKELKSKVYLLKHFENYIMGSYTESIPLRIPGHGKYLRMKHVIVFKLSHDVLPGNISSPPLKSDLNLPMLN